METASTDALRKFLSLPFAAFTVLLFRPDFLLPDIFGLTRVFEYLRSIFYVINPGLKKIICSFTISYYQWFHNHTIFGVKNSFAYNSGKLDVCRFVLCKREYLELLMADEMAMYLSS